MGICFQNDKLKVDFYVIWCDVVCGDVACIENANSNDFDQPWKMHSLFRASVLGRYQAKAA